VSAAIEDSVLTDQGVDVFARARLDWAGGVFATTTGGFTGPERRWGSVVGTVGGAVMSEPCFSHAPESAAGTSLTITEPDGSVRETLTFEPSNPRADMLSDFAGVVSGRIPAAALPVSPAHSLAVMTALDLVHEKLGRAH
jgi:predicted dehydrogenase